MKRRLNILCVIVMLVLSYSVLESLYYLGIGVGMGIKASVAAVEGANGDCDSLIRNNNYREMANMKYVALMSHTISGKGEKLFNDSVYNEKSGKYVPAVYGTMILGLETQEGMAVKIISKLLPLFSFFFVVWAVILFIKIIVAINRSDIFNWRNVRRLRRLGVLLVIGFCFSLLAEYLSLCSLREVLSLHDYDLTLSDLVNGTTLVLGLTALIVAEVFAIGLKMKEEQELTI